MSIIIAPQYTQRTYTGNWAAWKTVQSGKSIIVQWDDDGYIYTVWGYDGPEVHVINIWKGTVPDGMISSGYSQTQNDSDKADFEANYKASANLAIEPRTATGIRRSTGEKSDASRTNFYTHNFCDKTTWYTKATYVAAETPTTIDYLTYTLAHQNVIDTYHGKLTLEDQLSDGHGGNYRVKVTVNGIAKTEHTPGNTDHHYSVDYVNGTITFLSLCLITDTVSVSYFYATTSHFTVSPYPHKSLNVLLAKARFTTDVQINDTMFFDIMGKVDYFAPQLMTTNGGPLAPGTSIQIQRFIYKTLPDFLNDAHHGYSVTVPSGGSSWRGNAHDYVFLEWDYTAATPMLDARGMQLIAHLEHDIPFTGTQALAVFYCTSSDIS